MKALTRLISSGLTLGFLISGVSAQDVVDITGKVTDQTGKGLQGVTVILKILKTSATTGSDGTYRLTSTSSALKRQFLSGASGPAFDNRVLKFNVLDANTDVLIKVFNLLGKPVASLVNGKLAKGSYRINPFVPGVNSQIAFLSIKIGKAAYTLKMFGGGDPSHPAVASIRSELNIAAELAKSAAAATDTLAVSKMGWSSDNKTLEAFTGVYDFMLVQPDVFWGNPATYPVAKNVMTYVFLNRTNGKYADDKIFWSFGNQTKTIAEQSSIDMPANSSGRVNFHLDSPTGKYSDFIEHTISPTAWNGNTTRVDGYGLPVAIRLICGDGTDELLGEKYDIFYKGRDAFFKTYKDEVPAEFYPTADNGAPFRIIAPGKGDGGFGVGQKYGTYFDAYLKELGIVGATTNQTFACEGNPFGQNAQLAGAVNRHVAHLPKAEWLKAENFYKQAPANYYAKFFHEVSFQKKAYGFAYDDADGYAAYSSCSKPKYLLIAIGY